ncbi:MAG: four helix bundle protein, partial [Candidatus Bipolaricaulota bacterium]|nr:four helix bundle protein [Candidatus Bipolaricaulota bacterium]
GGGFDSQSNRSFIQFLGYSLRSATEVQSHLYVALDQGYITQDKFNDLYQQAVKGKNLIHGLALCNDVESAYFTG